MGANAQTSVPTFTAGEVLTAANMNISARTGVPVFSNTTTRDAGFGGTGEKTLAEGQLCYLEDSNVVQYYDGSTWATVGPTAASAMTFITSATLSGSSTTISNCFSATYVNYFVTFEQVTAGVGGMRLAIGTANTNYYGGYHGVNWSSSNFQGAATQNAAYWTIGVTNATQTNSWVMWIMNPQITAYTWCHGFSAERDATGASAGSLNFSGILNSTTGYTSLVPSTDGAGGFTGGTVRIYGIANS